MLNQSTYPYFQSECFKLCEMKNILEVCGQINTYLDNFQLYFTAYEKTLRLFGDAIDKCRRTNPEKILKVNEDFENKGEIQLCDSLCPMECDTISYEVSSFITSLKNHVWQEFYYSHSFL